MDRVNATSVAAGGAAVTYKTIPQGATTSVWSGLVAAAEERAVYTANCHVAELVESAEIRHGVRAYALDPQRAEALWDKSEEMVGERF